VAGAAGRDSAHLPAARAGGITLGRPVEFDRDRKSPVELHPVGIDHDPGDDLAHQGLPPGIVEAVEAAGDEPAIRDEGGMLVGLGLPGRHAGLSLLDRAFQPIDLGPQGGLPPIELVPLDATGQVQVEHAVAPGSNLGEGPGEFSELDRGIDPAGIDAELEALAVEMSTSGWRSTATRARQTGPSITSAGMV
jgi:hypothetical protein